MRGSRKGGFSLDSREQMLASEGAVLPGDAAASTLIHLVRGDDPEFIMPARGERLNLEEIALLTQWIDQGAAWPASKETERVHPHVIPRTPDVPAPRDGIDHPIDLILDEYFDEERITPTNVVDDAAFLRRVTLDITGLLPKAGKLGRVRAGIDKRPREAAIDRLLADDAAYAAHWLSFWNDLLRNDYSGTGYIDGGRTQITAWLYEALHTNQPYDEFVSELVNPTAETAGFAGGIRWRGEASASQRWELQYARSVSQVFLGVNMKCASCHDSFIDGWKLTDAYGLAAVIADEPLELYRCDQPTGAHAAPAFIFPEVGEIDASAGRADRLASLAALMTDPANGRTTRTIVNRVWARLMGRGLVEPVDTMAGESWNEDLLDYLASHLVEHDYDLRETIRLITTSAAYQRRAITAQEGGPYVFRGPSPQRMTAEQFVDAVWWLGDTAPDVINAPIANEAAPRVRASLVHATPLMRSLGRPPREQIVSTRPGALTTLQALDLANGTELNDHLTRGATRLIGTVDGPSEVIDAIYLTALSRSPNDVERDLALDFLGDALAPDRVADLMWTVIMLPEFQLVR